MAQEPLTANRTLYLVDGTYTVFRSYFAIQRLSAPDGTATNGVYGFINTVRKLVRERCPDHLGVAFDVEGPTHRDGQYSEYKANRPAIPDDLMPQFELAMEASRAMGWPVLTADGFEADDVLATLSRQGREAGLDIVIVTSDKDLYQLVGDGVVVLNPSKEDRILDPAGVADVFGVLPGQVVDVLALMGDAVDNVPGVPGIGEKTAKALVQRYGDVEAVLDRAGQFARLWEARGRALEALEAADREKLQAALSEMGEPCRALSELEQRLAGESGPDLCARFSAAIALGPGDGPKNLKKVLSELEKKTQPKVWLTLAEHAAAARLSKELVTIRTDAPVRLELETMHPRRPDYDAAIALCARLGFRTLRDELEARSVEAARAPESPAALAAEPSCAELPPETPSATAESGPAAAAVVTADPSAALAGAERIAVVAVTAEPGARQGTFLGLALAGGAGSGSYIAAAGERASWDASMASIRPALADRALPKVGHDLKSVRARLRAAGVPLEGLAFDTMIAAALLDPDRTGSHRLDDLAQRHLGITPHGAASHGPGLGLLDPEAQAAGSVEQATLSWRLVEPLREALRRADLLEVFETIEMPLVSVLDDMEQAGIRIDTGRLAAMSATLDAQLVALEREIHGLAGRPFNINSPPQLRTVLFDELKLSAGRRTQKTRVHSTGQEVLEALADEHPLPAKVLEYRELSKLKGTYVDALPRLVDARDGRVHTQFHQLGAATGRLSSSDPNLQNIPVRSETGRLIRAAFVPEPGWLFLSADYSQMELRILAHLADDPQLIEAFERDLDIHRYTAALVAGIEIEDVTPALRAAAKAVNFGIVYGMSEYRLARDQSMSIEEARLFIASYFARYPRIREYIDGTIQRVLGTGEVRTLFGRSRRFPELLTGADAAKRLTRPAREALLRQAVNATVQGTGADIVKRAMLTIADRLRAGGYRSRLVLQVHDELLLEVPPDERASVEPLVRDAMGGAARLAVPLKVDLRAADSWAAAH